MEATLVLKCTLAMISMTQKPEPTVRLSSREARIDPKDRRLSSSLPCRAVIKVLIFRLGVSLSCRSLRLLAHK